MTTQCPYCGSTDFTCNEVDYELDEYLYECEDCGCLFMIREEIQIIEDGHLEDEDEEEEEE